MPAGFLAVRLPQLALAESDVTEHLAQVRAFPIHALVAEHVFHQELAAVSVINGPVGPDRLVVPQNVQCQGMPRSPLGISEPQHGSPLLHLVRGILAERHSQNAVRRHPAAYQHRHPVHDDAGLARTRTREHPQGAITVLDGLTLLGVHTLQQLVQVGAEIHLRRLRGRLGTGDGVREELLELLAIDSTTGHLPFPFCLSRRRLYHNARCGGSV